MARVSDEWFRSPAWDEAARTEFERPPDVGPPGRPRPAPAPQGPQPARPGRARRGPGAAAALAATRPALDAAARACAHEQLGRIAVQQGDPALARTHLRSALADDPTARRHAGTSGTVEIALAELLVDTREDAALDEAATLLSAWIERSGLQQPAQLFRWNMALLRIAAGRRRPRDRPRRRPDRAHPRRGGVAASAPEGCAAGRGRRPDARPSARARAVVAGDGSRDGDRAGRRASPTPARHDPRDRDTGGGGRPRRGANRTATGRPDRSVGPLATNLSRSTLPADRGRHGRLEHCVRIPRRRPRGGVPTLAVAVPGAAIVSAPSRPRRRRRRPRRPTAGAAAPTAAPGWSRPTRPRARRRPGTVTPDRAGHRGPRVTVRRPRGRPGREGRDVPRRRWRRSRLRPV